MENDIIFEYEESIYRFFMRYMISIYEQLLTPSPEIDFYAQVMFFKLFGTPQASFEAIYASNNLSQKQKNSLISCFNKEQF